MHPTRASRTSLAGFRGEEPQRTEPQSRLVRCVNPAGPRAPRADQRSFSEAFACHSYNFNTRSSGTPASRSARTTVLAPSPNRRSSSRLLAEQASDSTVRGLVSRVRMAVTIPTGVTRPIGHGGALSPTVQSENQAPLTMLGEERWLRLRFACQSSCQRLRVIKLDEEPTETRTTLSAADSHAECVVTPVQVCRERGKEARSGAHSKRGIRHTCAPFVVRGVHERSAGYRVHL